MRYKYQGIFPRCSFYPEHCGVCGEHLRPDDKVHFIDPISISVDIAIAIVCTDCFPLVSGVRFADSVMYRAILIYNDTFSDVYDIKDFLKLIRNEACEIRTHNYDC